MHEKEPFANGFPQGASFMLCCREGASEGAVAGMPGVTEKAAGPGGTEGSQWARPWVTSAVACASSAAVAHHGDIEPPHLELSPCAVPSVSDFVG